VDAFTAHQPQVALSLPLAEGETIQQFFLKDPFMLVDDYFSGPDPPLPKKYLAKKVNETDSTY
jgi:recombinational DNA repair ATPase RecF